MKHRKKCHMVSPLLFYGEGIVGWGLSMLLQKKNNKYVSTISHFYELQS